MKSEIVEAAIITVIAVIVILLVLLYMGVRYELFVRLVARSVPLAWLTMEQSFHSREPSTPIVQMWKEVAAIHEMQMSSYERREKEHLGYAHNRAA